MTSPRADDLRDSTPVLVVASWFPHAADPASGRFVADQVGGLIATGRVRPRVVSFDPIRLVGGAGARTRQATSVGAAIASALEQEGRVFIPGIGLVPDVDVARLGVAEGQVPSLGTIGPDDHRRAVLRPLAARLAADGSNRPALVHAHTGFPDGSAATVLADALGCPLVITEHATFLDTILADPARRARYAAAVRQAARVIAVSSVLANQLRDALPEIEDRLVVLPNAVAVDDFRPAPLAERRPDELLFVGYRGEIKGIGTLLEAFAIVHAARPSARLRLIGGNRDPALEQRWHDDARRLGIAAEVSFEDVATRSEVADAMARASVFAHASRYETFGVVVAEALAAGTPVVATASGGVGDILGEDPGGLGAMVPVDDPVAFAAAVLDVLDRRASFDPARLRATAERFAAAAVGSRLADLYADVLAEHRSGEGRAVAGVAPGEALQSIAASRAVVVGLDRRATAALLAKLPAPFRATITLVTSTRPGDVVLPATAELIEVAVPPPPGPPADAASSGPAGRTTGRLRRVLTHPVATLQVRSDGDALSEEGVARATAKVRDALRRRSLEATSPAVRLIALDGRDLEVAVGLAGGDGPTVSVGGIRRLADEWSADRGSGAG